MEQNPQTIGSEPGQPKETGAPEVHPMDALLGGESLDMETPRRGEIRRGTIARISDGDVLVDIGAKSEGIIPARELEQLPPEIREALAVGSEISVYVIRAGGGEDGLVLSLARAEEERDWTDAERLLESQETLHSEVAGYNKGGLIVKLGHLRGFIPASQVSLSRRRRAEGETPDKRWGKMVGEPIVSKVIEVDRRRNRLILSERAAAREARKVLKEHLITELKAGEIRSGHVISLADFGAFVDIGGADGLVHLSEISWRRIAHPKDLLKVGQEVQVKVLGVDPDRKRISLSMRELEPDPWQTIAEQFREGQLVEGQITKLTKFGAFATLKGMEAYEIEGLIHISELSDRRVEHPREVLEEGQTVSLRVIKLDQQRRRIGLSLKRVDSAEYAEMDWQSAMRDLSDDEPRPAPDAVEDFDADLEAEGSPEPVTAPGPETAPEPDKPPEPEEETHPAA